ncbi:hypothetical protein D3C71_2172790 [compost metagenome]
MDDRINCIFLKYRIQKILVADIAYIQLAAHQSIFMTLVQIIDNHDFFLVCKQFGNGMGTDISGSSGN